MSRTTVAPLAESALLVIDAQDSFRTSPRWERRSNPDFERNVAALVQAYRAAGLPVIFLMHTDGDAEFSPGHPLFRLMDFLAPRPDEPVIVKTTRNCFTSTNLQPWLLARGCAASSSRGSRRSSAARRRRASPPTSASRWTS